MREEPDWRLHGAEAGEVGSDGTFQIGSSGNSTLVLVDPVPLSDGRTLALPIPNATAMLLHASQRAYDDAQKLLGEGLQRINPSDIVKMRTSAKAVDLVEQLTLSVFAAYTSLECFANEWVPERATYPKKNRIGATTTLGKEEIERQLSLKVKLDTVLPAAFQIESPKGKSIWEAFVKLESARHRVVHMKQADRESSEAGTDTVWKMLFKLAPPHVTAKSLVDWYMVNSPYIPGLAYDKLLPVKPRWLVKYPSSEEPS